MIYLLYTVHIMVCMFLILVVLLQQGKGADLSVFGGGTTQTAFGARGATTLLHKLTVGSLRRLRPHHPGDRFAASVRTVVSGMKQRRPGGDAGSGRRPNPLRRLPRLRFRQHRRQPAPPRAALADE